MSRAWDKEKKSESPTGFEPMLHVTTALSQSDCRNFSGSAITTSYTTTWGFLQFDWLRAVVVQLNLKYLYVKITHLLQVVV